MGFVLLTLFVDCHGESHRILVGETESKITTQQTRVCKGGCMKMNRKEIGQEAVGCISGDSGYCDVLVLVFTLYLRLVC